jgi:hypothetical protein
VLGVIGLSLPEAFAVLAPTESAAVQAGLSEAYRPASREAASAGA